MTFICKIDWFAIKNQFFLIIDETTFKNSLKHIIKNYYIKLKFFKIISKQLYFNIYQVHRYLKLSNRNLIEI